MPKKEAIHPGDDSSPELDKVLSVDGCLVAQTHDFVYTARELKTHVRGEVVVWLLKIQRRRKNSGRWVIRGNVSGEKSVYRFADSVQRIVETGASGERLIEPGEECVLDLLTKLHSESVV